ncbi:MAG: polyprenol monophosphomannose synthase [Candidatus Coatesbacteria bacterium]|nr:MAG: polyprenol monophosphomannose synthase [Candidatus Coatesbacteria bacterium]
MAGDTLVVIPTYNERENVGSLCETLLARPEHVDVLVVDDNSPDGTAAAAEAVAARYGGRMHILLREGKGGRGGAVLAGFAWGLEREYRYFFEMDADFSHRPEEIPLFREAVGGADVVVGSRYLADSRILNWPWARSFFSRWANRYARFFLRIPITDYTNGYRCYRRQAVAALDVDAIRTSGYIVLSEVAYQLYLRGFRFAEVPTVFVNRRRGESNLSPKEILSALVSVIRLRWRRRRLRPTSDSA